jgi:hypothetical protein
MIHTAVIAPAKEPICSEAKKNERQCIGLRSEWVVSGVFLLLIA